MKKLTVNIDSDVEASLDSLLARFDPFLTTHAIAAAAMRVGMEALAADPERLPAVLRASTVVREAQR